MRIKRAYYRLRYYNILAKVAESTDKGQREAYCLIKNYQKVFEYIYGRDLFREIILNYRVHYHIDKKKVLKLYTMVMKSKKKIYKSDIVISLNLLNNFYLSVSESILVYSVFSRYFGKDNNIILKLKAQEIMQGGKRK